MKDGAAARRTAWIRQTERPIGRPEYLDRLLALQGKRLIKVITGIRRCGKSTLLELFQDELAHQGVADEQIIAINFEDYDYAELLSPASLHAYLKERLVPNKTTYIFLDEIQQVADFPRVVDSLFLRPNVDIYLTGSNAYMLSGELATLISGRYVEIAMLPLSFAEYMAAAGDGREAPAVYREYVETSSFPYIRELLGSPRRDREIREYLSSLYSTVVIKDIAQRKGITDLMMLESVVRFLYDNIGNPLSTKRIADTMTVDGRKIDTRTVEKYISALTESFVVYAARRYDIKGRQYLKTQEKYYAVDAGMRLMLLGRKAMDAGHMLENIVYLELLRRSDAVFIGKIGSLEVDFISQSDGMTAYYQVALTARDESVLARELLPLEKISDHYPKYLLTLDDDPAADYGGIQKINAIDWLLKKR